MIGIILIAISWGLLRIEKRPLSAIGFNKPQQRLIEFLTGLFLAGSFATLQFILIAYFSNFGWKLNSDFNVTTFVDSLRWNINSVLFEELIFRGYLLYKAIEMLGVRNGCLLSAIAFGVYHWFSYGIFGNVVQMIYVFLLTGSFGLALALSFAMSKSVILPIALHLGWNLVTILVFSNGPLGAQLLISSLAEPEPLSGVEQFITSILMPVSFVLIVGWLVTKKVRYYQRSTLE
ncbi:MAG: CPBP family intramembrane metalloprotease [Gammaproteobacteria bacterium]|nr:CPBP family intramembrane metalloprotease [Gammaproteobacteria bacterium]